MTLSLPPQYVPLPVEVIEQAYAPDKPHRALFASFVRLLSLAWENKYQQTPRILEEELYNIKNPDGSTRYGYLKLERRQYFEQRREMELLGWLRSTHPAVGFVQFSFTRSIKLDNTAQEADVRKVAPDIDESAKNRTLKRIEEEESFKSLNTESSSSSSLKQNEVREIALIEGKRKTVVMDNDQIQAMKCLVENLHLAFEPETFSVLEWRDSFLAGIPERVKGWIAKAYQDRMSLNKGGGPLGLIVKHILEQDVPHQYFIEHFREILPAEYLEAIGDFEIECYYCTKHFSSRAAKDEHQRSAHAHHCDDCNSDFETADALDEHYNAKHDPYRKKTESTMIAMPASGDSVADHAWQDVLDTLRQDMPRASFETWVESSAPVRYDGNTLFVRTRNVYARDWLENRLTSTVNRLLIGILGKDVQVSFVVDGESA
jgi:hypothetical protein